MWKVAELFAVAGALVSLLAGLVGGNPFGVIVLRLALSALAFAGVGALSVVLLGRFVPELLRQGVSPAQGAASPPGVDIVIDEELPLADESLLERSSQAAGSEEPERAGPVPPAEDLAEPEGAAVLPGADTAEAEDALPPLPGQQEGEAAELPVAPEGWQDTGQSTDSLDALAEPEATPGLAPRSSREAARERVEKAVAGQDPAELAKAVRTFMRKDQEG